MSQIVRKGSNGNKNVFMTRKATRTFARGDSVFAEDFSTALEKWIPGTIEKVTGPVSYQI